MLLGQPDVGDSNLLELVQQQLASARLRTQRRKPTSASTAYASASRSLGARGQQAIYAEAIFKASVDYNPIPEVARRVRRFCAMDPLTMQSRVERV